MQEKNDPGNFVAEKICRQWVVWEALDLMRERYGDTDKWPAEVVWFSNHLCCAILNRDLQGKYSIR